MTDTADTTINPALKLLVVDVDGTLLDDNSALSEGNIRAIRAAQAKGVPTVLATGKTWSSCADILDRLGLDTPGIYLQGLAICERDGTFRHQQHLRADVARDAMSLAEQRGFATVAYSGNRLLARKRVAHVEALHSQYHEPPIEYVGPIQNLLDTTPINKLVFVFPEDGNVDRAIPALRWQLGALLQDRARLMRSVGNMLEVLPAGTSKGNTLRVLLKEMNVEPGQVLAIGNAENDAEMLRVAAVGVAVGNAPDDLKEVADYVAAANGDDGVADAIIRYITGPLDAPPADGKPDDAKADDAPADGKPAADAKADAAPPEAANGSAPADAPTRPEDMPTADAPSADAPKA